MRPITLVGCETGTTVTEEYTARESGFIGMIKWVRLEAGLDSHERLIDPSTSSTSPWSANSA